MRRRSASAVESEVEPRAGAPAKGVLRRAKGVLKDAGWLLTETDDCRKAARLAFEAVRERIIQHQLDSMPLGRLREATEGRLRLGPLEAAGFRTVGAAARAGQHRLEQVPGVGPQTAAHVVAAARQLEAAMEQGVRLRFDVDARPSDNTQLLAALRAFDVAEQVVGPLRPSLEDIASSLGAAVREAGLASSRIKMFFAGRTRRAQA